MNDFALPPEDRKIQQRETRDFHTLSRRLRRDYSRTGYILAGVFAVIAIADVVRGALYPATVHDLIVISHDRSTGWAGLATSAQDAPKTWGVKEAHSALTEYVWSRERYIPELQQTNEARVKAMSSVPVWTDYTAALKHKEAPKQRLAAGGHVDVFNVVFFDPVFSPDLITVSYPIRFNRREVKTGDSGEPPTLQCDTTAAFQWHPEMLQDRAAAILNAWGLMVISYQEPRCK